MIKYGKMVVFLIIIMFSVTNILIKSDLNIKDNVYVVSDSETEKIYASENDYNKEEEKVQLTQNTNESILKQITIYISGEVKSPGVVTIQSDKRLSDAIEELGGVTEEADLNGINLAMKIEDEKHYIIPKKGDIIENSALQMQTTQSQGIDKEGLVNINTASIEELDTLPGIGETTAKKIENYRSENGNFKTIEEIKNVNGIGDKKYIEIKEKITVK